MTNHPQWLNSREVTERVVITGRLVLDTPASFGSGDAEGLTDMPLLRDPLEGKPLLTGATIAGALRNYLRELDGGYAASEDATAHQKSRAELLFGHLDHTNANQKASVQSWLIIDDALGEPPAPVPASATGALVYAPTAIEVRDGVSIDPATRTAKANTAGKGQKYDYELLAAGTTFDLTFELWRTAGETHSNRLLDALLDALSGFEPALTRDSQPANPSGEIGLGLRKRRGLGACHVENWQTHTYNVTTRSGLIAWLTNDRSTPQAGLPAHAARIDQRRSLHIVAQLDIVGSLMIRAEAGNPDAADMVHLRSQRNGQPVPILSGTSVAGAIRGRALRIAHTVLGRTKGQQLVDAMFGRAINRHTDQPSGSLVLVRETSITGGKADLVQNRVKIDRFTGGSYPAALFSQEPLWSPDHQPASVVIDLTLKRPIQTAAPRPASRSALPEPVVDLATEADFAAAVGLLLLVLKDLWLADLPLGGESSVGRGRLRGQTAWIECDAAQWTLHAAPAADAARIPTQLTIDGDVAPLNAWVDGFNHWPGAQIPTPQTPKEER